MALWQGEGQNIRGGKGNTQKLSHGIMQTVSGSKPSERIRDTSLFTSGAHFGFKRLSIY